LKVLAEKYTLFFRDVRLFFVNKALKTGRKDKFVPINVIKLYRGNRGVAPYIWDTIGRKKSTSRSVRFTPRDTKPGIH
jgi:hypothetical protein